MVFCFSSVSDVQKEVNQLKSGLKDVERVRMLLDSLKCSLFVLKLYDVPA